ncbi:MAG: type III polyketide synthase [Myxococcota bacterium]
MRIASVGRAFPGHYYTQEELIAEFGRVFRGRMHNLERLAEIHRNARVGGRHLALPLEAYEKLDSFGAANDAFIANAVDLAELSVTDALERAGLAPRDVDAIFSVSVTGIAAPSTEARLAGRIALRPDVKRVPIFGLGCVAGTAGIARAADYVKAYPDQVAVLLSVELCSLTFQRGDFSIPNVVASGLFGDGSAAAVVVGAERPEPGPRVVATRSVMYPDTERVMGWDVTGDGFRIVLSGAVPDVVRRHVRRDVDRFLADQGLALDDVDLLVCHPGGPKVLEALEDALDRPRDDFAITWRSLRELGNLSSASVLMVLRETLEAGHPPGTRGLMLSMGPGFCSELALLEW